MCPHLTYLVKKLFQKCIIVHLREAWLTLESAYNAYLPFIKPRGPCIQGQHCCEVPARHLPLEELHRGAYLWGVSLQDRRREEGPHPSVRHSAVPGTLLQPESTHWGGAGEDKPRASPPGRASGHRVHLSLRRLCCSERARDCPRQDAALSCCCSPPSKFKGNGRF